MESRIIVQVVDPDRRLQEVEIERRPVADCAQSRLGIGPHVLHVHHERHLEAEGLAHGGDHLGMAIVGLVEPRVGIGPVHGDLGLDRLVAELPRARRPGDQAVPVFLAASAVGL